MTDTIDTSTAESVRGWLIGYAWAEESEADKEAVADCIMAQDDWRHIAAVADAFASAQEQPGPKAMAEGTAFALSALYECHDGPHQPTCPNAPQEVPC